MFIYVGCSGGMTSSMFCQRIIKAIEKVNSPLRAVYDDVGTIIRRKKEFEGHFDLVFAYGGINYIEPYNAYDFGTIFDVVFIAPQMRHMTKSKQEILKDYPVVVKDIGMKTFGTMDGETAYNNLLDELIGLDYERSYVSMKHPETKNGDKNIELLVLGANKEDSFFKSFFDYWGARGLRVLVESYSLETLYDFHPAETFDIRVLFGSSDLVNKEDFPKLTRRIDSVMMMPFANPTLEKKKQWFSDYHIPVFIFSASNVAIKNGEADACRYDDILDDIVYQSEFTREISPAEWETPPPKKIKKTALFGLISWE
ncbi:PTS sugar transporter subunit IIB [Enterococcus larvae]|uniref:PTS sugar transporter subunit IIB n=1 Tax=Enterococcus larvae TaxID=2794352 RepID=UPI003F309B55